MTDTTSVSQLTPRQAYFQGLRAGTPFVLVIIPFGIVFGVVATEAGLNVLETLLFSVAVIAGAAQLAAIQLMSENAPVLVILATGLAVNLRMAMYSAALAPHLGAAPLWQRALVAYLMVDQGYATAHARFEQVPEMPLAAKVAFYFGAVSLVCPLWYVATLIGALTGSQIPAELPIEFAVPATFIAIITPMLRTLAHVAAALVSVVGTLALGFLPYNLGLLIAAVLAMMTAAQLEKMATRRREGGK
ncbi:MAG: putative branched-chain amino acid permease (azaleucine resistance) [Rhodobacteraceae bacterium HLUCCA12]|nr:MAG: putative branched-chain amino acid permease (azaleucine resistance) [Rhodobacteraceae bacterium HLUCCA12]